MYVKCPEGWSTVRTQQLGRATIRVQYSQVQISAGVCDSADLCGRTSCRFYNTSPEATLFMRAQAEEHSLEALERRLSPH